MAYGEWGERFQNEWGVIIHMGEENCREGYGKADGGFVGRGVDCTLQTCV